MLISPAHPLNAYAPIDVSDDGNLTLESFDELHPLNAYLPMLTSLFVRFALIIDKQFLNA